MTKWNLRPHRKPTGGKLNRLGKKTRSDRRPEPLFTRLGELVRKTKRSIGGAVSYVTLSTNMANVTDPSTGKTKKVRILTVVESPSNPNFIRRNIITRGSTVNTEAGKARVTSRPSRSGVVNAVLVEQKK
ncbi:MAG: 30S ribosomal protein S8e [Candidatus Aenigmarchaeota archaeon]|nr:30S ribosomal protein S8e [Candidatus Aenigmarchaeota archaeon]